MLKICCTDYKEKEQEHKNTERRSTGERWMRGPTENTYGVHHGRYSLGKRFLWKLNIANPCKENASMKKRFRMKILSLLLKSDLFKRLRCTQNVITHTINSYYGLLLYDTV